MSFFLDSRAFTSSWVTVCEGEPITRRRGGGSPAAPSRWKIWPASRYTSCDTNSRLCRATAPARWTEEIKKERLEKNYENYIYFMKQLSISHNKKQISNI